jgi:hypothetical protein
MIKNIDIVNFSIGDPNECRDIPSQIKKGMQLYSTPLIFEIEPMEKSKGKDRLSMNPRRKQCLSVQDRNHHRHIAVWLHGSRFGQSRCRYASPSFHLHRPACCGRPCHGFPYDKASLAWPSDSILYREGFHDRSAGQKPCREVDHSM